MLPKLCGTLFFAIAAAASAQTVPNIKDVLVCPNSPNGRQPYLVNTATSGHLRRVFIEAPNAKCNDGSTPEMYVRTAAAGATEPDGPSGNRWLIHLLGGSNCDSYEECGLRWCGIGQWEGTLMTTNFDGPFRNTDGLLGRSSINRLANRNEVLMKYCSSDGWAGRKADTVLRSETDPNKAYSLNFQGANIFDAAISALERGVEGMPRLTNATDVLLSGDSAGSHGARTHLDRLAARLKGANPSVRVRGNFEAGFNLDFNGKQGVPAGDPADPPFASNSEKFNRIEVGQRNAVIDESCLAAHGAAPFLCTDDGYLTLNHITAPFFQIMDIQDPLYLDGLLDAGLNATPAAIAQALHSQISALVSIKNTAVERAAITAAPGVAARNCGLHVTYGSDDSFLGKRLRTGVGATAYSYYDLLWNWMNSAEPSVVLAAKPPLTPDIPATDTICGAQAPTAPAPPAIATVSSANYGGTVAPEAIATTFGSNLAASTVVATTTPWPTALGGVQVRVTDSKGLTRIAPVYFVSPTQVQFLIPAGTALGTAQVTIGAQTSTVEVAGTAPAIYTANQSGQGVAAATYLRITSSGVRSEGYLFDVNTKQDSGVPAAAGDQIYLLLYGTGLRGGPATATVGGIQVPVAGPVAQGQYQGLDQINLGPLPLKIGFGQRQIVIRQGDDLANITTVTFRPAP